MSQENQNRFDKSGGRLGRGQSRLTISPGRRNVITIGPSSSNISKTVRPPRRAAWEERGWRRRDEQRQTVYEGYYQVKDRKNGGKLQFAGRIEESRWKIIPYIAEPPGAVMKHPKWVCFTLAKAPWFQIHWYRSPKNVDDCLLYVERILDESINGRKKKGFWETLFNA